MDSKICDCLIIGGGASGLFAAARLIKESGGKLDITVVESGPKPARKLLLTGSGRCNFTNLDCDDSRYKTDDEDKLSDILIAFDPKDTINFFKNDLGVLVISKGDLYYPSTFKSSTVADSLRLYVEEGANVITGSKVTGLTASDGRYNITLDSGSTLTARNVILATGGASYPGTGSDGTGVALVKSFVGEDSIVPFTPALVPLTSDKKGIKPLAGIRCSCDVMVVSEGRQKDSSDGEVLFTKEGGLSGICIMDVSATALRLLGSGHQVSVKLNLMTSSDVEVYMMLTARKSMFPARTAPDAFAGMLDKRILEAVMHDLKMDINLPVKEIKDTRLMMLANALCGWEIPVNGAENPENAQVSAGGVKLSALTENLCVKDHPGLYVIGEACNVNGICGGYNLQWAWSSAACAARDIAYV